MKNLNDKTQFGLQNPTSAGTAPPTAVAATTSTSAPASTATPTAATATSAKAAFEELQLSGFIKNLLQSNITMLMGTVRPVFVSEGTLAWPEAEEPRKLTRIGTLNDVFPLLKPAVKLSEQDVEDTLRQMLPDELQQYEQQLRVTLDRPKRKPPSYYIVSQRAAVVTYRRSRSLLNLLVPAGATILDQKVHFVGFAPAWTLFESTLAAHHA